MEQLPPVALLNHLCILFFTNELELQPARLRYAHFLGELDENVVKSVSGCIQHFRLYWRCFS